MANFDLSKVSQSVINFIDQLKNEDGNPTNKLSKKEIDKISEYLAGNQELNDNDIAYLQNEMLQGFSDFKHKDTLPEGKKYIGKRIFPEGFLKEVTRFFSRKNRAEAMREELAAGITQKELEVSLGKKLTDKIQQYLANNMTSDNRYNLSELYDTILKYVYYDNDPYIINRESNPGNAKSESLKQELQNILGTELKSSDVNHIIKLCGFGVQRSYNIDDSIKESLNGIRTTRSGEPISLLQEHETGMVIMKANKITELDKKSYEELIIFSQKLEEARKEPTEFDPELKEYLTILNYGELQHMLSWLIDSKRPKPVPLDNTSSTELQQVSGQGSKLNEEELKLEHKEQNND